MVCFSTSSCTHRPPKRNVPDDPPDMPISLRLKYGVHTIFLLVDPLAPFSEDPHDESKGWKDLKIDGSETPIDKGLKNNMMVAFVIRDASEADEAPQFLVQWPKLEDDEEDEDGMDEMDEDEMEDEEEDEL
ncbi:hypothetical protein VP1G_04735 [Cytospora mali]|uniref:Uncharacterized protein n=1 Tax=Cytospora mali TaxID=578113 RepID=A0A194V0H5_CYTMA|nr:hypothetical protein VP1G_04735 [Valsa mali var. pyri (nom. inval.)]